MRIAEGSCSRATLVALDHCEEGERIDPKDLRDFQKLDHIKSTFTLFDLADERLRGRPSVFASSACVRPASLRALASALRQRTPLRVNAAFTVDARRLKTARQMNEVGPFRLLGLERSRGRMVLSALDRSGGRRERTRPGIDPPARV